MRIVFSLIVGCIALYFLYILRDVLLPFCVACLLAYILEPWVEWNGKILHIKSHTTQVLLTCFEWLFIFASLCLIFIPVIGHEFEQLSIILHKYIDNGYPALTHFPETVHNFIHKYLDIQNIIEKLDNINTASSLEKLWESVTSGLDKVLGVLGWLMVFIYVVFILLDFEKYKKGFYKYIPQKYMGTVKTLTSDLSWSMKRYFRNQAFISFITGLCYIAGFSIVGLPMAVVIGLMNMVLFMVPYLVYVSLIPVTVMCVFKSMETGVDFWNIWLECAAVYVVVELFSDLILTPRIMGKAMGLNPAVILLSLSVWGSLLGLLGMVIALPATTILSKWANLWLTNWRNGENAKFAGDSSSTNTFLDSQTSTDDS